MSNIIKEMLEELKECREKFDFNKKLDEMENKLLSRIHKMDSKNFFHRVSMNEKKMRCGKFWNYYYLLYKKFGFRFENIL